MKKPIPVYNLTSDAHARSDKTGEVHESAWTSDERQINDFEVSKEDKLRNCVREDSFR